jgi:CO/xanthine dehydrogenase Mo-binding subunit
MAEEPKFDTSGFIGQPFGTPFTAYIFGAQAVEVEVDVETGQVTLLNAVAAHDMGQAININGVEGQIEGGFVQALGMALSEAVAFDKTGRITNPNFTDYKIPAAADVPPLTPIIVEAYDETGPFGAKGLGEGVIMGAAPAIANAIYDAVGVRLTDLPMTPERLLAALEKKRGR